MISIFITYEYVLRTYLDYSIKILNLVDSRNTFVQIKQNCGIVQKVELSL